MQLSSKEEILVEAFRRLPAATAEGLSALTQRLADLGSRTPIDWSEAWSDADLHAFTADTVRRLDTDESEAH